ncbi:MAG: basic secretory family protein [Fimbriimonadales bacterium]|nr:basic secretory family protein [Fimbriimonadales bacterium]
MVGWSLLAGAALLAAPKVTVEIDVNRSPSSAVWAAQAKALAEEWYPELADLLRQSGWTPPRRVTLRFEPMEGVAGTAGDVIHISEDWIRRRPDDWGMVIHELVHVVQAYRKPVPGWITEGIADGIRYGKFEPQRDSALHDPERSPYRDGYWSAGAFLTYLERLYDRRLFTRLNEVARRGEYSPEFWRRYGGRTLEQLWDEYRAWYRRKAEELGRQPRLSDLPSQR